MIEPEPLADALTAAVQGCADAEDLLARIGVVLGRTASVRESWYYDADAAVLHARAAGRLPLEERARRDLDPGTAALLSAACAAEAVRILEGEIKDDQGVASGRVLLALPLRDDERLLGVFGLLAGSAETFAPVLTEALARASTGLVDAVVVMRRRLAVQQRDAEAARAGFEVARVAAAVAHEIRNPLAAMSQAVVRLEANATLGVEDKGLLELLREELARVNRLSTRFLTCARPPAGRFETTDIGALIERMSQLLRRDPHFVGGVTLVCDVAPGLPGVRLDADQIHQVLWNLCLNAAEASPPGDLVRLRVRVESRLDEDGVLLEIRDHGPGIAPAVRARLFEPFATARAGGTGLGLALARVAVAVHAGSIRLDDAPEGGTVARVWLPAAGPRAGAPSFDPERT